MTEKILLVDDDRELREELSSLLEGYQVKQASSGEEALAILGRANDIDLVIMDVKMSGISGLDALKKIKLKDPGLSIVILTGYSNKDTAIEALRGHANDFIEKPCEPEKIKEVIERLLKANRRASSTVSSGIEEKVAEAKLFLERNCFKKATLDDAAQSACLSPKYLSRIFKEHTGQDFSEYKLKIKIEKSKELLTQSSNNINQISEKLGYENPESFIRQFKKFTHYTPKQYRLKTAKSAIKTKKSK
jgi:YesN/AraC family two-component response regulator